jgi:RHS repeat-associated protein
LTYDANGNLTNDGTNTYTWDARNRLTAISGGLSASFVYDGLGRRISKTVNGVTTQFLYDGNDIIAEFGSTGTVTYLRGLNIDEPFVRISSASAEYYHQDALGSTLALTNQTGAVQASYQYEAFGKTTVTGTSSNPFQFTGRENDGTGLSYYRARYFNSGLARFLSEDPILAPFNPLALGVCRLTNDMVWLLPGMIRTPSARTPQQLNPYVYVTNNSLRFTDPFGLVGRPCGSQIDKCIADSRRTPAGDCTGTQYGLYFGGEEKVSSCKKGVFSKQCLMNDLFQAISNCLPYGPLPPSCTTGMEKCINTDPSLK